MRTLLRKLRKSLIESGGIRKYILYAIGEIALVVIGIMLALEFNNRNENKIKYQKEISYLETISSNLHENLNHNIEPGILKITQSIKTLNSYNKILEAPSFNRDVDSVITFLWDITNPLEIVLNTVGFDNLTSTGIDLISNPGLKKSITTLYGYDYKNLDELENRHHNFTRTVIWPTIQNNINFSRDSITDRELNFLLTDGPFYSRIYGNEADLKEMLELLKILKPRIEQLILDINNEIKQLNDLM